jgi:uncharacterized protein YqhQ
MFVCEATEADTAGVVFLIVLIGKPPRPRCNRMLRAVFLIARLPLLAVMQGGDYRLISIHSHVHKNPNQKLLDIGFCPGYLLRHINPKTSQG